MRLNNLTFFSNGQHRLLKIMEQENGRFKECEFTYNIPEMVRTAARVTEDHRHTTCCFGKEMIPIGGYFSLFYYFLVNIPIPTHAWRIWTCL